jgi:hypothetical protein
VRLFEPVTTGRRIDRKSSANLKHDVVGTGGGRASESYESDRDLADHGEFTNVGPIDTN